MVAHLVGSASFALLGFTLRRCRQPSRTPVSWLRVYVPTASSDCSGDTGQNSTTSVSRPSSTLECVTASMDGIWRKASGWSNTGAVYGRMRTRSGSMRVWGEAMRGWLGESLVER
jgi:hypothetical protein